MKYISTILVSLLTSIGAVFCVYNYVPLSILQPAQSTPRLGSTITTINGSDTLSSSRAVINTNFSNLNTDKLQSGNTAAALTITSLTLGNALAVLYGGTGTTTAPAGQVLYGNTAVQSVATSTISVSSGLTTTGTQGAIVGGSSYTLKQIENRSFTVSTTTWTGTTTIALETGYNEVWNNIVCYTNTGTLNVQFGYGTASTSLFNASTTQGTLSPLSNNTMTAGNKVRVDIGTPASSPTTINCKVNDTI